MNNRMTTRNNSTLTLCVIREEKEGNYLKNLFVSWMMWVIPFQTTFTTKFTGTTGCESQIQIWRVIRISCGKVSQSINLLSAMFPSDQARQGCHFVQIPFASTSRKTLWEEQSENYFWQAHVFSFASNHKYAWYIQIIQNNNIHTIKFNFARSLTQGIWTFCSALL